MIKKERFQDLSIDGQRRAMISFETKLNSIRDSESFKTLVGTSRPTWFDVSNMIGNSEVALCRIRKGKAIPRRNMRLKINKLYEACL